MGLGLNGGGLESARFSRFRGAEVTVTDLRDEKVLAPSIAKLSDSRSVTCSAATSLRTLRPRTSSSRIPAVKPDSALPRRRAPGETDLSIFLSHCHRQVIAVTGSKGKSSTASPPLHWVLNRQASEAVRKRGADRRAFLGGNITVSLSLPSASWTRSKAAPTSCWNFRAGSSGPADRVRADGGTDALGRPPRCSNPAPP
jgi:UDP-N-acetylmuramoylalanine--D-glutamate ligase